MTEVLDFVPIWTLILGLAVFFYVLLDGFDLGVGMLYGFAPDLKSRNTIMNSIAPIWDGNETWLVLGGIGLLAAFPLAFAIIIPAVYFPVLIMLLALVFRGVAFEFRFRDAEHKSIWDHGFCYGSAVATFAQGLVLGSFIQGFRVEGRNFAGTTLDFLTPFSVLTGIALMFGYGLLGAGWLVLKTDGEIQAAARRHGRICLVGVLLAIGIVSIWTPLMNEEVARRWFAWPNISRRGSALHAGLYRHRDQPVAHDRSLRVHTVGSRLLAAHAGFPPRRDAVPLACHSHVHGMVVLGFPRKGHSRSGLPLISRESSRRSLCQ
jgi:cytochrome d ubiquinol oxidase subunit II